MRGVTQSFELVLEVCYRSALACDHVNDPHNPTFLTHAGHFTDCGWWSLEVVNSESANYQVKLLGRIWDGLSHPFFESDVLNPLRLSDSSSLV